MLGFTILCTLLSAFIYSASAQDPPFTVTRPGPGDTLVLSTDKGANEIYIDWSMAGGTEDSPVYIALQRGEDLDSLETIEFVDGSVINDGSYTWVGSDSVSLESGDGLSLARTGCNYTVRLLVDGLVAYSQYFTIINEADGPVPNEAICPVERGIARPQFADTTTTSTTIVNDDALSGSGSESGIRTSTLAVAIVVPIVVLLILFGLLLWFGIRRGWFVKLANRRNRNANLTHENTAGFARSQPMSPATAQEKKVEEASPAPAYSAPLSELHSDHRAWEAERTQVHQLEGDERDARWGDANIRGN